MMQSLTKLLLLVALASLIPWHGGRYDVQAQARVLQTGGDPGTYQSYLESLFIEAGMENEWGSSLMQQRGGNGRSLAGGRQLLTGEPQCEVPDYTTCYVADGSRGYCCPQNPGKSGKGKRYQCKSTDKFTCENIDDTNDVMEVKESDGSGAPGGSSRKKTVQVVEVDSPEDCYKKFPNTAGICGLECGKAYCCPQEAPYCNGPNKCLNGEKKLHSCTALTDY